MTSDVEDFAEKKTDRMRLSRCITGAVLQNEIPICDARSSFSELDPRVHSTSDRGERFRFKKSLDRERFEGMRG